jgi:cytochrome c-type biogenesis protein CcmH/NrfF
VKRALVFALALAIATPIAAQDSLPPAPYAYTELPDPAQEAQALALMQTIRCLTCQSQSVADSDAQMAGDMRHLIRTRIAAGETPDQVRDWLVERYGDYISYEPTISQTTWPLFAGPVLLVLLGAVILYGRFGRRRKHAGEGGQ